MIIDLFLIDIDHTTLFNIMYPLTFPNCMSFYYFQFLIRDFLCRRNNMIFVCVAFIDYYKALVINFSDNFKLCVKHTWLMYFFLWWILLLWFLRCFDLLWMSFIYLWLLIIKKISIIFRYNFLLCNFIFYKLLSWLRTQWYFINTWRFFSKA